MNGDNNFGDRLLAFVIVGTILIAATLVAIAIAMPEMSIFTGFLFLSSIALLIEK